MSRSLITSRQRAYRVYTLLGLAALVGFGGGALARRVVNHHRAIAAVADDGHRVSVVDREVAPLAPEHPPAMPSAIEQVATDAALPVAPLAPASGATGHGPAAIPVPSSVPNAPMRLVRASPDAGMLKAVVEPPGAPSASSKQPEMVSVRVNAPKSSAPAAELAAPVPTQPNSERAPVTSDDENPL